MVFFQSETFQSYPDSVLDFTVHNFSVWHVSVLDISVSDVSVLDISVSDVSVLDISVWNVQSQIFQSEMFQSWNFQSQIFQSETLQSWGFKFSLQVLVALSSKLRLGYFCYLKIEVCCLFSPQNWGKVAFVNLKIEVMLPLLTSILKFGVSLNCDLINFPNIFLKLHCEYKTKPNIT